MRIGETRSGPATNRRGRSQNLWPLPFPGIEAEIITGFYLPFGRNLIGRKYLQSKSAEGSERANISTAMIYTFLTANPCYVSVFLFNNPKRKLRSSCPVLPCRTSFSRQNTGNIRRTQAQSRRQDKSIKRPSNDLSIERNNKHHFCTSKRRALPSRRQKLRARFLHLSVHAKGGRGARSR
jgi:hypothetical protein